MKIYNKIFQLNELLTELFPSIRIDVEENQFSFSLNNLDGNCYLLDDKLCLSAALSDCRLMDDEAMSNIDDKIADLLYSEINNAAFNSIDRDLYYTKLDGRIIYLQMNALNFSEQQISTFFELAQKLIDN
jgi:hypothetical protein